MDSDLDPMRAHASIRAIVRSAGGQNSKEVEVADISSTEMSRIFCGKL